MRIRAVLHSESDDFVATFDYGKEREKLITCQIDNEILKEGVSVDVNLSIPAEKGKYKAWTQIVKVTRENKNTTPEDDPLPVLQSMKIHEVLVVNGKVTVPNEKGTVSSTLGSVAGDKKKFTIKVVVEDESQKDYPLIIERGSRDIVLSKIDVRLAQTK